MLSIIKERNQAVNQYLNIYTCCETEDDEKTTKLKEELKNKYITLSKELCICKEHDLETIFNRKAGLDENKDYHTKQMIEVIMNKKINGVLPLYISDMKLDWSNTNIHLECRRVLDHFHHRKVFYYDSF